MGRCREMHGDAGRCREVQGDIHHGLQLGVGRDGVAEERGEVLLGVRARVRVGVRVSIRARRWGSERGKVLLGVRVRAG